MRILTTFRDIAASTIETPPAFYLKQILMRQLAMKDNTSASWTAQLKRTLAKYGLPSAGEILEMQPRKQFWGQLVKNAILRHWTDKLQDEAQQMSTLAYLKLDASDLGKLHSTWLELHNKLDIRKASVKAQLLVQRYPLSGNHTAGERKSTQCILCHQCEETTAHFLLHCSALYQARHLYLPRILDSLRRYRISVDPPNLVFILLDTNHLPSDVSSNDRQPMKP